MSSLQIRNVTVVNPAEKAEFIADIGISGGIIVSLARDTQFKADTVIDGSGLVAAPGLADIHVHFRDPGQTDREDITTGSRAAAAGGFTDVACMPNTDPVADSAEIIEYIRKGSQNQPIRIHPIAAITKGSMGRERISFGHMAVAGAKAFSDDGRWVADDELMREALMEAAKLRLPVISHCEDLSVTDGGIINEGEISRKLGVKGIPAMAEERAVERDIRLSKETGCPVHIAHVSTKGSVELIRQAKRDGVKVTAETCPHYFSLTQELLLTRDADYRMSPPLRTKEDMEAIIGGLKDKTIDCIVTDHAPHTPEMKRDFTKSPNGVIGLETSLAVGITFLVRAGHLRLNELLYNMTTAPREVFRLEQVGINIGEKADIVLFDPGEKWIVDVNNIHSKSINTPYKAMELTGRVKYTIKDGIIRYADNRKGE